VVATGVFPLTDVGVVVALPLSRAVVLPDVGFLVAVVGFAAPVKVLDAVVGGGFDDAPVAPVAGFTVVGVVTAFTGAFVLSTFALVAGVVGFTAGGLFVAVVGFVVVTAFFGSGF
jgi:hypothetical protein